MIDGNTFGMNFALSFFTPEGEAMSSLVGVKPIGDGKDSDKIYLMAKSVSLIFIHQNIIFRCTVKLTFSIGM